MIQRIQTVFLLLSIALISSMFLMPIGEVAVDNHVYIYDYHGFSEETSNGLHLLQKSYSTISFIFIIVIINIVAIFLFKNRKLQMRLALYNLILMISMTGLSVYMLYHTFGEYKQAVISFDTAIILPLIAAVLNYLAFVRIRRDEALVRSIDRIR